MKATNNKTYGTRAASRQAAQSTGIKLKFLDIFLLTSRFTKEQFHAPQPMFHESLASGDITVLAAKVESYYMST